MTGIPPPGAKSFELPAARVCPDATPAPSAKQEPGAPGFLTALPATARQFDPATSIEQEGAVHTDSDIQQDVVAELNLIARWRTG